MERPRLRSDCESGYAATAGPFPTGAEATAPLAFARDDAFLRVAFRRPAFFLPAFPSESHRHGSRSAPRT